MKRDQPEVSSVFQESESKHRKTSEAKDDGAEASTNVEFNIASILGPHMEEFEKYQSDLCKLDAECAREQMSIQKKYDEKKKNLCLSLDKKSLTKYLDFGFGS